MTPSPHVRAIDPPHPSQSAEFDQRLFGIPIGRLGWFASLLIGTATGFAAFFAATFLAILVFLVLSSAGHPLDYSLTYRRVGLPVGLVVGALMLSYMAILWVQRTIKRQ